jgi:pyruvate dehydrogenase E2 component (dihydrolipoamide acetyltransferase)
MESGTIVKWLKREGDAVEKGDLLYEIDTEKVTQEVEAEASGVLLRITVPEGEVPVGETIAWIGDAGETIEAPTTDGKAAAAPIDATAPAEPAEAPPAEPAEAPPAEPADGPPAEPETRAPEQTPPAREAGERVKASPLARRIARERGLDLAGIVGTGPEGRIVAEDVERAASAPTAPVTAEPPAAAPGLAPAEVETVPLTSVRRTIARRLTQASQVPVFQLVVSADMERTVALLDQRRDLDPDVRVTVTDLLIKVCATALMRHREVNVQFSEEALLVQPSAHVAIAVAAPQGLVVPVVRDAERRALSEIAAARSDVVERARNGKLKPADLEGGTFTISNLGMFGIEQFTAILNPPQAAILAVGAIEERPVARAGEIAARPMMTMTLTCDHRAVDGAPAAAFLELVKALLEEPGLAL